MLLGNNHTRWEDDWTIRKRPKLPIYYNPVYLGAAEGTTQKPPTFREAFSTKLGQSTTKIPPELHNTASWEQAHTKQENDD